LILSEFNSSLIIQYSNEVHVKQQKECKIKIELNSRKYISEIGFLIQIVNGTEKYDKNENFLQKSCIEVIKDKQKHLLCNNKHSNKISVYGSNVELIQSYKNFDKYMEVAITAFKG
jgi:hypothetical protein